MTKIRALIRKSNTKISEFSKVLKGSETVKLSVENKPIIIHAPWQKKYSIYLSIKQTALIHGVFNIYNLTKNNNEQVFEKQENK